MFRACFEFNQNIAWFKIEQPFGDDKIRIERLFAKRSKGIFILK